MSSLPLRSKTASFVPFPRHIGIINDYVRIPYANGSSFASRFFYREFTRRGHAVTVLGPRDRVARESDLPRRAVLFDALALRNHPGVRLALPSRQGLTDALQAGLDLVLAQTGSGLLDLGVWLRAKSSVPLLCVNTIHLPSVYNVLLPDSLHNRQQLLDLFDDGIIPEVERLTAQAYNLSDGLVVLCSGLERYWRERGVTVPIHVIPRPVDPSLFDAPAGTDPFPAWAVRGQRLLCVCRHSREKNVERLLKIFAEHVVPRARNASLTLVGDGPDHDSFVKLARELGVAERVYFPGEYPVTDVVRFYRHADVFVYASLSETYGQVVSEARWCGLPVVAFADEMGVSHQLTPDEDAYSVAPGPDAALSNRRFGEGVLELLEHPWKRRAFGESARHFASLHSDPELCIERHYSAFWNAREHCARTWRESRFPARAAILARWAALHTLLAGLGCLRRPAIVNRHGRAQPGWDGSGRDVVTAGDRGGAGRIDAAQLLASAVFPG